MQSFLTVRLTNKVEKDFFFTTGDGKVDVHEIPLHAVLGEIRVCLSIGGGRVFIIPRA